MGDSLRDISRLLDSLQAGAALVDRTAHILHANSSLRRLLLAGDDDLAGRSVSDFFIDKESERRTNHMLTHFDDPREVEVRVRRADGDVIHVIVAARPAGDDPPWSDWLLITVTDITSLMSVQAQITELSDTVINQALELKHYNVELEHRVRSRTAELRQTQRESIYMLALASEGRDLDTGRHIQRIRVYSESIAREFGLDDAAVERIGYSAVLHDVGKLHIPDSILKKPGPLTDDERRTMQRHTILGETIISDMKYFDTARAIARSHHENHDGTGYPDGLAGEDIPLPARIVRIADVFDALSSKRIYKPAWSVDESVDEICRRAGTLFDPDIADVFRSLHASGRLTDIRRELVAEHM